MGGSFGYLTACLIGTAAAFAELVTRYRDRPIDLITFLASYLYTGLNAGAAAAALVLIRTFGWSFGATSGTQDLIRVMVAGFGSLALFRSSLFSVRVGEADVNIGPSTLLTMALNAADLGVNRSQARRRSKYIKKSFEEIDFTKAKTALPAYCLGLLEGLEEDEQKRLSEEIDSLTAATMSDQMKSYNLGLALLRVTGVSILRTAVRDTKDQFKS